ncbi:M23 family metallopeptidase [Staphylococcus pettenkoferi]|uniref:lysostaphin n=1 Tax=Staphylococcus pettenkoferi TaxID=170573 RepID=A0ABT4BK77_9STAP|nr:M23 family metallopeptidase [Staphylococcus pettenkoferi]MCY1564546.1 M23 family metallopeptidase [Staphylococcus pettenkoferi]MCY1572509.1 M23 family metallopeptidase [Staphylococcus pettenkoferi]MCY1583084.1 M23 family metallopeptidase [Staphylococcus pettenkoferi]MCY1593026.1 M23 family metallopeptidase [Staphylococcus pettenkoferi]MCY1597719.1 M23 family metallopeptidase [Staphylococcus pettenkoferi]
MRHLFKWIGFLLLGGAAIFLVVELVLKLKQTQDLQTAFHLKYERQSRETETFGEYRNDRLKGKHYGIDYALPKKTPVKAATDGEVTRIFTDKLGGKVLQIAETDGQHHQWYMHLHDYNVEVGDHVKAGDIVAYSGNTGKMTTGPHLHFQRMNGGVGNRYAEDPATFVDQLPDGEESLYDL